MAFESKDIKNSVWLSIQYIILITFSFVGLKLSLLAFEKNLFGIWLLLSSIFGLGIALDFGIGASVVRLVSSKRSNTSVIAEFSNSFVIIGLSGILISTIMVAASQHLIVANEKIIAEANPKNLYSICLVLGGSFFCGYLNNFFRSAFEGLHRFKLVSILSILNSFFQFFEIVVIYYLKLDVLFLAEAYLLNSAVQFLIYLFYFKFRQNDLSLDFTGVNFKTMGKVLNQNFTLQTVTLLGTAIDPIIKYTIGILSSASNVTVYEISRRFVVALSGIFSSSFRNTLPKISMLKTQFECQDFLSKDASHISNLSVIYSVLGFGVLAPIFLIVSDKFYHTKDSIVIFLILVLVESTNNIGYVYYTYIIGIKREKVLLIVQCLNVVLTYLFLRLGFKTFDASTGIIGFYLSVLVCSFLIFYFVSKFSDLLFSTITKKSGWKILFPFHLLVGVNILLCTYIPNFTLIIQIGFCGICSLVLLTKESKELMTKIRRIIVH